MKSVSVPSRIVRMRKDGTSDTYHVRRPIGKGGFATVYEVSRSKTDQLFALKAIKLSNLKNSGLFKRQMEEIKIQFSLNHPNILHSYDYFQDESNFYIVLELCPYHSVHRLLKQRGKLSELDAGDIIFQVLQGVQYLHRQSVIHRDIKLENLLIGADGKIKISDFGVSIRLSSQIERCYSTCGTYGFMPPEMLVDDNDGYSFESDIWAIGVCTFLLLTGQSPFKTNDRERTEKKIKKADYKIPSNCHLSSWSKDFIHSILQTNPENRPSIDDLLNHPFIDNSQKIPHTSFFQEFLENKSQKLPEEPEKLFAQSCKPKPARDSENSFNSAESPKQNERSNDQPILEQSQLPKLFAQSSKPKHAKKSEQNDRFIGQSPPLEQLNMPKTENANEAPKMFAQSYRVKRAHNEPIQGKDQEIKKKRHHHSPKRKSPIKLLSPHSQGNGSLTEKNNENASPLNSHSIPSYCVIRFCSKSKSGDLYYLMKNGQVGMISNDNQRLVLDPYDEFIQMWPKLDSSVPKVLTPSDAEKVKNVSKLLKYAKAFKEANDQLIELPSPKPQKEVPMRHVKYWMCSESGLLFRMDNRVIQVNFPDRSKLIVFWEQKSLISTQSLLENGTFMTFSNLKQSQNQELKEKYSITKQMIEQMCS